MLTEIYTVGHSSQSLEGFLGLLQTQGVTAIADVRSTPYSRFNPQFNQEELRDTLKVNGIRYVFLGRELGARSEDDACYVRGKVQYKLLAQTPLFQSGIKRVLEGAQTHRIALMCAEKDPLDCHRTILIARELVNQGAMVTHILQNGSTESHQAAIARLVSVLGLGEEDMFRSKDIGVNQAYEMQAEKISYEKKSTAGILARELTASHHAEDAV